MEKTLRKLPALWILPWFLATSLGGCSTAAPGSVAVRLKAEELISKGMSAGSKPENVRDGWDIVFDQYLVAIGPVHLRFATDTSLEAEDSRVHVVDLTKVPDNGFLLWQLDELASGRWNFDYEVREAGEGARRHDSANRDAFERMVEENWSYWIEGLLTQPIGESCPPADLADVGDREPNGNKSGVNDCYAANEIRFEIGIDAEVAFENCEIDGLSGVAIAPGATETVSVNLHGDHLFFNGFPVGSEGSVLRLAQWLADADLNLDGVVVNDELRALRPADMVQFDERYQLGGSPISIDTMYDYVRAQLLTQGHFEGEGECEVLGASHDHGHDH